MLILGNHLLAQPDIKKISKTMVELSEGLFISPYEVSNELYHAFLQSIATNGNDGEIALAQIDSAAWSRNALYNMPYTEYYHKHPAYANYPVVNISHPGAEMFCEWLTNQINTSDKSKWKKVKVRLPSEMEWMMAAKGGFTDAVYAWKGEELRNMKGQYVCNFKGEKIDAAKIAGSLTENTTITAPVSAYWPNTIGLYNMCGNVAEMLSTPDMLKGGSWYHPAQLLRIDARIPYDGKAAPYAGFRFVLEVVEE